MSATILACVNQKGGVGKSATTFNLGVGLAHEGKKVLLVDLDAQASLTISMGHPFPDNLETTTATLLGKTLTDDSILPGEGILHHEEGVDLLPSSIDLAGIEVSLVNAIARETILKQTLLNYSAAYDYILIDCMPSLGMLSINALAAAHRLLIPVQAHYLSAKGLEQLLETIFKVRRQINRKLDFEGILLTMVDARTKNTREVIQLLRDTYGSNIPIFDTAIPHSVRVPESTLCGKSLFSHDPKGRVTHAYHSLTKEVLAHEHQLHRVRAIESR